MAVYPFGTFPDLARASNVPIELKSEFRKNIRKFLDIWGEEQNDLVDGMQTWLTQLSYKGEIVPFYTIEESPIYSDNPLCYHCRSAGWRYHYISIHRYHLIITIDVEWNKPLKRLDGHHVLHGLIHSNGFGHLLSINGHEGGFNLLCGSDVMELWDRLCTRLQTRLNDSSKKKSMDLRLLYEQTWFGKWNYKVQFRGNFGVKEAEYRSSLENLGSLKLSEIFKNGTENGEYGSEAIDNLVKFYTQFSETKLVTVRDLLVTICSVRNTVKFKSIQTLYEETGGDSISPYTDIHYIYNNILKRFSVTEQNGLAAKIVLDCKQLVKEWPIEEEDMKVKYEFTLRIDPAVLITPIQALVDLDLYESIAIDKKVTEEDPAELVVLDS
ncbi:hypothetical protein NE237_030353 [Protea cynaroides]|uniref:Uncharacterized protein n=1 Tax=Protea cynaroides TaxID=273540 RepID=A0A9Q0JVP9_9MAGN|nr:hypothetical protein NE237_030353 [Protea cynaroides]